jgi:hypothetical protein
MDESFAGSRSDAHDRVVAQESVTAETRVSRLPLQQSSKRYVTLVRGVANIQFAPATLVDRLVERSGRAPRRSVLLFLTILRTPCVSRRRHRETGGSGSLSVRAEPPSVRVGPLSVSDERLSVRRGPRVKNEIPPRSQRDRGVASASNGMAHVAHPRAAVPDSRHAASRGRVSLRRGTHAVSRFKQRGSRARVHVPRHHGWRAARRASSSSRSRIEVRRSNGGRSRRKRPHPRPDRWRFCVHV